MKEDIKTLILIGGLPCLAVLIGFLLAFAIFPEDGFHGMVLVSIITLSFTLISILFMVIKIWHHK